MKIVWCFADPDGKMLNVVLVTYKYDGIPEETMLVNPHGNSKKKKPEMDSTKAKLSQALGLEKPKDTIDTVFKQKGGLIGAKVWESFHAVEIKYIILRRNLNRKLLLIR